MHGLAFKCQAPDIQARDVAAADQAAICLWNVGTTQGGIDLQAIIGRVAVTARNQIIQEQIRLDRRKRRRRG